MNYHYDIHNIALRIITIDNAIVPDYHFSVR